MKERHIQVIKKGIVHRDEHAYSAHPHAVIIDNREILLVFNQSVRRSFVLHPPEDPRFINFLVRSSDGGETWSTPQVVPGYNWCGMECSGLTNLGENHLIINQWKFSWFTLDEARQIRGDMLLSYPSEWVTNLIRAGELENPTEIENDPEKLAPWVRGAGNTFVHHSFDNGKTWEHTTEIDVGDFSGGYGMRGGVVLPDGSILLPLSDVPHYEKVFTIKSSDGYEWEKPRLIADLPGAFFEEPCPFINERGQVVIILRDNTSHSLYQTRTSDDGDTWTRPVPLGIDGYPADVSMLEDGRFIMVFGRRVPPLGIFAVISEDGRAETWENGKQFAIDDTFTNKNLGYPTIVPLGNDHFFVGYYGEDNEQTTCIWGSQIEVT